MMTMKSNSIGPMFATIPPDFLSAATASLHIAWTRVDGRRRQ